MQEIILQQREIGKYIVKFIYDESAKYDGSDYVYYIEKYDTETNRTLWRSYHKDRNKAQRSFHFLIIYTYVYHFCSKAKKERIK